MQKKSWNLSISLTDLFPQRKVRSYILKARIAGFIIPQKNLNFPQISSKMPQNGPKMAKNDPKWPKVAQIWPKMALEWPKMIQSGPKMTQNGTQLPQMAQKWRPDLRTFSKSFVSQSLSLSSALWAQRLAHKTLSRLGMPLQRSNTLCYSVCLP